MENNRLKEIHKFLDENDNWKPEELIKNIRKDFNLSVTGAIDIYFSWKKQQKLITLVDVEENI